MKKLKALFVEISALSVIASICGCSSDSTNGNSENNISEFSNSEIKLSEAFSTDNDAIWYYCLDDSDNLGKDTVIAAAYIFQDGELCVCQEPFMTTESELVGMTLGEAAKMSDAEIIDLIKTAQNNAEIDMYMHSIPEAIIGCDYILSQGICDNIFTTATETYDFTSQKGFMEELRKTFRNYEYIADAEKYGFGIYTDKSGNTAESEVLAFTQVSHPDMFYQNFNKFADETKYPEYPNSETLEDIYYALRNSCSIEVVSEYCTEIENMHTVEFVTLSSGFDNPVQVYETSFDGYSTCKCSYDGPKYSSLVTKSTGKKYVLDDVDTEGIMIDPSYEKDFLNDQEAV